ncbi:MULTISPECIES: ComEA family DNA-binding protein [Nocardiaceae]|uniref:ComEA family DNA-binding protein n=1 Tax=Nocardiaceae TaxID=85025 RepID=UPI00055F491E|nr:MULTISPECIES: helix-hairpin-helix domain-containing protein [Rhodococcus]OZE96235.1 competence protein ComEA [Rhodococcus sp. 15-1189-1-1a]OZF10781.1 competence protein ComEA [Rhodococcus sp. 14-2686-1-2]OZF46453.1 competence protein ComEA [Rhodococcus sp. 14-2470-1b]
MSSPRARPISREAVRVDRATDDHEYADDSDSAVRDGPERLGFDDGHDSALSAYLPERWRGARMDPGRTGLLGLCGVGLIVLLVAGYAMLRDSPQVAPVPALPVVQPVSDSQSTPSATEPSVPEPPSRIVVSVVGLVVSSGLVNLPPGARVADAIAAAGGVLEGADMLALNLAAKVSDGDQIIVGVLPPEGRPVVSGTVRDSAASSGPGSANGPDSVDQPGSAEDSATGSTALVNLNTATVAELDALDGVGPVTAANIVAWREVNGKFGDIGQLAEVDGIGPVRLEKLRPQVTV